MKNRKIAAIMLLTIFALALIPKSYAQENNEIQTFYEHDEAGLIIKVKAPLNTEPGHEINVTVSLYCYAKNLSISYLYVTVFDFKGGRQKNEIGTITFVEEGVGYKPKFNQTEERTYKLEIHEDVWDVTYGEVSCKWTFGGHTFHIRSDGFTMTYVQNVEMERLMELLANKTEEYEMLWENYTRLNQTYWEEHGNKTSAIETELSNTRLAMVILIITTVFFIATTLYLIIKKPREYW